MQNATGHSGPLFKRLTPTDAGTGGAHVSGPTLLEDIRDFFPRPAGPKSGTPTASPLVNETTGAARSHHRLDARAPSGVPGPRTGPASPFCQPPETNDFFPTGFLFSATCNIRIKVRAFLSGSVGGQPGKRLKSQIPRILEMVTGAEWGRHREKRGCGSVPCRPGG
jgi:hypothetical protein